MLKKGFSKKAKISPYKSRTGSFFPRSLLQKTRLVFIHFGLSPPPTVSAYWVFQLVLAPSVAESGAEW